MNPDRQSYPDFIRVIQQTSSCLQAFNSTFPCGNRFNFGVNYGGHGGGDTMQWEPIGPLKTAVIGPQRRAKWVSRERMEKRRQERRYLRCGGAGHRVKECPYLPPQSSGYLNLTPWVSPTPGDLFTGAGLSEHRRRVRQVNNSKAGKKGAEISVSEETNAIALGTDSGADTDAEKE